MAKLEGWSGNSHSKDFLENKSNLELVQFCNAKESVYIFGDGEIGRGIKRYLNQSGFKETGIITTPTFEEFSPKYIQGKIGVIVAINDRYLNEVMPLLESLCSAEDILLLDGGYRETVGRQFSVKYIKDNFRIHVYLASHCNLACKGCRSFSPINRPDFYQCDDYSKDILQLKQLEIPLNYINFTGGEPFLNPEIFDILKISRQTYPEATIQVFTNGTLLSKLTNEQLRLLVSLDIPLVITEYPIKKLKLDEFLAIADTNGIKYKIISYENEKLFTTPKFDSSRNAPLYDFYNCYCYKRSTGLQMYKGKLYQCVIALFSSYFDDYFGTKHIITKNDYVDIYNTSPEDIYRYKSTRIPFCGYCDNSKKNTFTWGVSEKKIEEWT